MPSDRARVMWICARPSCIDIAAEVYRMKPEQLTKIENDAAISGGGRALGEFLDHIGKTDLATMTEVEFAMACQEMVKGYSARLHELLKDEAVPF